MTDIFISAGIVMAILGIIRWTMPNEVDYMHIHDDDDFEVLNSDDESEEAYHDRDFIV